MQNRPSEEAPRTIVISPHYATFLFLNFSYLFLLQYSPISLFSLDALNYLISYLFYSSIISVLVFLTSHSYLKASLIFIIFLHTLFNIEHILINNGHLNFKHFSFLFNKTFALSLINLEFFKHFLYLFTLFCTCLSLSIPLKFKIKKIILIIILPSLFIVDQVIPNNLLNANWNNQNPFNIELGFFNNIKNKENKSSIQNNALKKDLNGKRFYKIEGNQKPNILLIILEGFSQKFLDFNLTPNLKKLSQESLHFDQFITNQLQTNRGLYTLNCSDYPNMLENESKADLLNSGSHKKLCLPRFLKDYGYTNYFIQSAPLAFMRKDQFAKAAGYDYALGANSFGNNKWISNWGVGDNTLFGAIPKIIEDHKKNKTNTPFFLSALTVGTHHPYITPVTKGDLAAAIHYTDKILSDLMNKLEEKKLLDNTLIIITSDEAKVLRPHLPLIENNWGLLILKGLDLPAKKTRSAYSQLDLALSVTDLLNLGEESPFVGRSFFRDYQTSRAIYFANVFNQKTFELETNTLLNVCDHKQSCRSYSYENEHLFRSPNFTRKKVSKNNQLFNFIKSNDLSSRDTTILFHEDDIKISSTESHILFSELKLKGKHNSELRLSIEYISENFSEIKLIHQYYICSNTSTFKEQTSVIQLQKGINNFSLSLPKQNKVYCNSLLIKSSREGNDSFKTITLYR